ncbi:hypothetical protein X777_02059 [Ooceraea biroi]|uniref:Uncharacterized protein n=1 Tax=Ooceraea biroi TaxID=2015173 RepID=A0A026WNB5_OOCBI|nr:hypothetical protein X777_02059 [Ooceraea biroi]
MQELWMQETGREEKEVREMFDTCTFKVQRWQKIFHYYGLIDERIIGPIASFSPGIQVDLKTLLDVKWPVIVIVEPPLLLTYLGKSF